MRERIIIDSDENKYFGEWNKESNMKDGRGVQVGKDGSRYEGQFWKN